MYYNIQYQIYSRYKAQVAKTSKPLRFLSLGGWWLKFLSFGHQFDLFVQLL